MSSDDAIFTDEMNPIEGRGDGWRCKTILYFLRLKPFNEEEYKLYRTENGNRRSELKCRTTVAMLFYRSLFIMHRDATWWRTPPPHVARRRRRSALSIIIILTQAITLYPMTCPSSNLMINYLKIKELIIPGYGCVFPLHPCWQIE